VPVDLSGPGGVDQLMQVVEAREDRLHILVNNAGAAWGAPLEEYPLEAFDKLWNINIKAMFALTVRSLRCCGRRPAPPTPAASSTSARSTG